MQKVIDHHSVKATRAELILSDDKPYSVLHIDSRLVLTPGVPSYSEEAVFGFVELVNDYRQKHGSSKVVVHECD